MKFGTYILGWKQFGQYGFWPAFGSAALGQGGGAITFRQKLGVHPYDPTAAGAATWDSYYGGTTDFLTVFVSHSNWSAWDISIANVVSGFAGDTRTKVWTMGLCVVGTTLVDAAAGSFDSHYHDVAVAALADARADGSVILVRIGHEFNLAGTYPWETINSGKWAEYVTAFRRAVAQFRAVSGRFRFIWCPNWITLPNPDTTDITPAYPGDAYVDLIGNDLYYSSGTDNPDPNVAFNFQRDVAMCGLAWLATFAATHGKPLAMCEFGLNWDKPQWLDLVYSWVSSHNYAYFAYWDYSVDTATFRLSDGSKPDCTPRFKADFKDHGPIPIFNHTFAFDSESFSGTGGSTFSVVSQVARITGVSNYSDRAQRNWTGLTVGQTYRVELDLHTGGKNGRVLVIETSGSFNILGDLIVNTAALTHETFTFVATQSSLYLRVLPYAGDAAQIVQFDNVQLFAA